MNIDQILTMVQAVSDSSLTSFKLEQGDTVISLRKEKEEAKIVTVGAPAAPAVFAASARPTFFRLPRQWPLPAYRFRQVCPQDRHQLRQRRRMQERTLVLIK